MEIVHGVNPPESRSSAMVDDLTDLGIEDMLQYDPCKNDSQNVKILPTLDEEPEVTLE